MALSTTEQELFDFARAALPGFLFQNDNAQQEMLGAFAKDMGSVKALIDLWRLYTFILSAVGMWLDEHAKDRGTRRQNNESDIALRQRLRTIQDAVNPASVKAAALGALQADNVTVPTGYPALVELRRDRGFEGTWSATPPAGQSANRKMTYLSRGYRMGTSGLPNTIIVILPYGTSAATAASVYEAVRIKKAGGIFHLVERRLNP